MKLSKSRQFGTELGYIKTALLTERLNQGCHFGNRRDVNLIIAILAIPIRVRVGCHGSLILAIALIRYYQMRPPPVMNNQIPMSGVVGSSLASAEVIRGYIHVQADV